MTPQTVAPAPGAGEMPQRRGMAGAGTVAARQAGLLPRWLRWTGVALAAAIIVSGIGYALLINGLALAAWVSLPLLLVWVTGVGITLGRSGR